MKIYGLIILFVIGLFLQGCTSSMNQATIAFEAAEIQNIRASNDIGLENIKTVLCASPYSAILRHPELWDVMPKLCAPGVREATPQTLLQPVK